ncbi:sporulation inhibitor of replication protein SirA [Halobacillus rhizosphaerae]|uniref:sporulation inhibitor of replication protein SirA n=1 Tax=Halobacillus rhizosphaerae TaxID=3064889 RepID=UPI00398ABB8F
MHFAIFAVKPEVSVSYYYKVEMMKRFLLECLRFPQSEVHQKQLEYITDAFPYIDWLNQRKNMNVSEKNDRFVRFPFSDEEGNYGIIKYKNNSCFFQCSSLCQADRMIFQPLRMSHKSFYILEKNGDHYGWISSLARQRLLL